MSGQSGTKPVCSSGLPRGRFLKSPGPLCQSCFVPIRLPGSGSLFYRTKPRSGFFLFKTMSVARWIFWRPDWCGLNVVFLFFLPFFPSSSAWRSRLKLDTARCHRVKTLAWRRWCSFSSDVALRFQLAARHAALTYSWVLNRNSSWSTNREKKPTEMREKKAPRDLLVGFERLTTKIVVVVIIWCGQFSMMNRMYAYGYFHQRRKRIVVVVDSDSKLHSPHTTTAHSSRAQFDFHQNRGCRWIVVVFPFFVFFSRCTLARDNRSTTTITINPQSESQPQRTRGGCDFFVFFFFWQRFEFWPTSNDRRNKCSYAKRLHFTYTEQRISPRGFREEFFSSPSPPRFGGSALLFDSHAVVAQAIIGVAACPASVQNLFVVDSAYHHTIVMYGVATFRSRDNGRQQPWSYWPHTERRFCSSDFSLLWFLTTLFKRSPSETSLWLFSSSLTFSSFRIEQTLRKKKNNNTNQNSGRLHPLISWF